MHHQPKASAPHRTTVPYHRTIATPTLGPFHCTSVWCRVHATRSVDDHAHTPCRADAAGQPTQLAFVPPERSYGVPKTHAVPVEWSTMAEPNPKLIELEMLVRTSPVSRCRIRKYEWLA